jgi:glycine hydroxymethyltransferase
MLKKQIQKLIQKETVRQQTGLVMIPSENYASMDVLSPMGTPLSNKYSEGYPGKRYYTGNQIIDQIETACQELSLKVFGLSNKKWHANVQPHSGSSANIAAFSALLKPGDKILAMDLGSGGHLSHGHKVNLSSQIYKFAYYTVNPKSGKINYNELARIAKREKPKMIICGYTAYTQKIHFTKMAQIAKKNKAYLLADIAHIIGLIIAGVHPSPFPYADVVTSTTHKTLAGPRGALIICKKKLAKYIDRAVFPGMQGGPLEHVIAAKAIALTEALKPKFKKTQIQTVKNAQTLAKELKKHNINLVADGTENHIVLLDCRNLNISGRDGSDILAEAEIYTNANMIPFDPASPFNPSGIRLGTPALSTRGMGEKEMKIIAGWISDILKNPNDKKLRKYIKSQVHKLTDKFPIY